MAGMTVVSSPGDQTRCGRGPTFRMRVGGVRTGLGSGLDDALVAFNGQCLRNASIPFFGVDMRCACRIKSDTAIYTIDHRLTCWVLNRVIVLLSLHGMIDLYSCYGNAICSRIVV